MVAPVSVCTAARRCQLLVVLVFVSTRLVIATGSSVIGGSASVPPTRPVCTMPASQSPAWSPSPGDGKLCVKVHDSTAVPLTLVVTLVSRLVLQNVGE